MLGNVRECHIQPDWLLIYQIDNNNLILNLVRMGSHSDLFKKRSIVSDKMNELSNREFIKSLEQKIPSKKVNFDNPVDVKEFFGDENLSEYEEVFKD